MSTIYVPDPNPGRCLNHRQRGDEMVRCLDYEGRPHVCTFPEPPLKGLTGHSWGPNQAIYTLKEPKPWVKP